MPGYSIGIIGGADGPTAVLVSGDPTIYIVAGIVAVLIAAGVIFLHKRRKR